MLAPGFLKAWFFSLAGRLPSAIVFCSGSRMFWLCRTFITTPLLAGLALLAACQSQYLRDRGNDALDIATLEVDVDHYGAALRLGPLKAGLDYKASGTAYGLRGGATGESQSAGFTAFFFGADYFRESEIRFDGWRDGLQEEENESPPDAAALIDPTTLSEAERAQLSGQALGGGPRTARNKVFVARAPFGTASPAHRYHNLLKDDDVDFAPATYFTQVEISFGLFGGTRVGLNPGEFLDFVLGWFGLDLFGDDGPIDSGLERQLRESPLWDRLSEEERETLLEQLRSR